MLRCSDWELWKVTPGTVEEDIASYIKQRLLALDGCICGTAASLMLPWFNALFLQPLQLKGVSNKPCAIQCGLSVPMLHRLQENGPGRGACWTQCLQRYSLSLSPTMHFSQVYLLFLVLYLGSSIEPLGFLSLL